MKQIPNIFTLLNLVFGCFALVFALQTEAINIYQGEDLSTSFNIPEKLNYAAICIGIAAIIDFLDGFIARLFKAVSDMGKQLDSLSDMVSFGVAPSVILYQFLRLSFMQEGNAFNISLVWLVPAFVFACAGAYRLARFNLDDLQSLGFQGVPIPAAGLVVASLPIIAHYNYMDGAVNSLFLNRWFLYSLIIVLSYLMISKLPLMALKSKEVGLKSNMPKIVLLILSIMAAFLLQWLAVPVIFVCYIALSLMFKNKAV
ncbi:MAG: CDP-alcohol phosphatidyltransferase family protein [Chitinophagaceae bacterium]